MNRQGKSVCSVCRKAIYGYTHVHHKDGDPKNNDPENQIYLCARCHMKEHGILKEDGIDLHNAFFNWLDAQKYRIRRGNSLKARQGLVGEPTDDIAILERWLEQSKEDERYFTRRLVGEAKKHVAFADIKKVKGLGPLFTAQLLASIGNFGRFANPSKLWKYAGLAPNSGKKAGQNARYNHTLKQTCNRISRGLIRNSPYKEIYDEAKAKLERTHPEWTKMHRHNGALLRMVKICLVHIWEWGRLAEGLEIVEPWILEQRGHSKKWRREDFV